MREAVIQFVVAQGRHIRRQVVHQFNGRDAFELRIYQRPLNHVTGDDIEDVFLFPTHPVEVAGEERQPADEMAAFTPDFC